MAPEEVPFWDYCRLLRAADTSALRLLDLSGHKQPQPILNE